MKKIIFVIALAIVLFLGGCDLLGPVATTTEGSTRTTTAVEDTTQTEQQQQQQRPLKCRPRPHQRQSSTMRFI